MSEPEVVEAPPTTRLIFNQPIEDITDEVGTAEIEEPTPADDANDVNQEPELLETAKVPGVEIDPSDDDDVSVEDLKKQQEEIARKIAEKQEAEKRAVIQQIVDVVNTYSIPVEELVEALGGIKIKRKGVPAVQKYRDPETGATWSGRGKEPAWIRGQDREKFLIGEE